MSVLTDIWNAINTIAMSGDYIRLGIIVVIALAGGFAIEGASSLINATLVALIVFAIANFVREVAMNGANAGQLLDSYWAAFQALPMLTVLAYALIFAILIAIVNLVRSLLTR
ncbi:MAG: hypothetical protein GC166_01155 [Alphaproteobacteria bacterium]|nr:hypothetical protein [Alphaproteobacteria bacterium]